MLDPLDWGLLALAAFAAGFIDAVGGGGGLVQLPALFGLMPGAPPAPPGATAVNTRCHGG